MSENLMEVLVLAGFAVFLFLCLLFFLFVIVVFLDPGSYFYVSDLIDDFMEKHFGDKTNGDMIRNMTDKELAEFLVSGKSIACSHCGEDGFYCQNDCTEMEREEVFRNWLAAENEEGV